MVKCGDFSSLDFSTLSFCVLFLTYKDGSACIFYNIVIIIECMMNMISSEEGKRNIITLMEKLHDRRANL